MMVISHLISDFLIWTTIQNEQSIKNPRWPPKWISVNKKFNKTCTNVASCHLLIHMYKDIILKLQNSLFKLKLRHLIIYIPNGHAISKWTTFFSKIKKD